MVDTAEIAGRLYARWETRVKRESNASPRQIPVNFVQPVAAQGLLIAFFQAESGGLETEVSMNQVSGREVVFVGGIPVSALTQAQLADAMVESVRGGPGASHLPKLVFSTNGQAVSMAAQSSRFRALLHAADIIHADGMSVVAASRLLSSGPLPERVATTDFFHVAAKRCEQAELRFFMLGATEEVSLRAYEAVQRLYPKVHWVGRRNGYFPIDAEFDVCNEISASGANVVWVGLGRPRQEEFAVRNRPNLRGVRWLKTCGGLMDFLADDKLRAPRCMQRMGLEWLFRLLQDPLRLAPRYAFTNVHAIWQFVKCGPNPLGDSPLVWERLRHVDQ